MCAGFNRDTSTVFKILLIDEPPPIATSIPAPVKKRKTYPNPTNGNIKYVHQREDETDSSCLITSYPQVNKISITNDNEN